MVGRDGEHSTKHLSLKYANILTHVQPTPNCYKVQKPEEFIMIKDQVITFTTPDPINFPLPSPRLLALHAACAKVACLSGAGDYIDIILEEMERIGEMA